MVKGIEKFREYFSDYAGQYVFIGGTACDLILGTRDVDFRVTKDLDIVLAMEALDENFVRQFISFIKDGGYRHIKKGTAENQFYRFESPEDRSFPVMIELFSRKPDYLNTIDRNLGPIHVSDDVISLSAILLDKEYYELIRNGMITIDGMTVLDIEYLILFKMKAWVDLTARKASGERIDSRDIKKHRNDVIRLASVMDAATTLSISDEIRADVQKYLEETESVPADMKSLGLRGISYAETVARIRNCYGM